MSDEEQGTGNRDQGLGTLPEAPEKARLAYRPMAKAEWLLAQRVRTRLTAKRP